MRRLLLAFLLCAASAVAQTNTGELRLKVHDPSGQPLKSSVTLVSEANQFRDIYDTDINGAATAKQLPYGIYTVRITRDGFVPLDAKIEIRSALPTDYTATLSIAASKTSILVRDQETLIDPYRAGSSNHIGADNIQDRESSLPGRSIVDLVNTQPGWLYEGNAVLHPRGSEYVTQFVVDGIPLTDNRSPSFGIQIEADDVQSLTIYTAGFPAEYGRKLGGVVDVEAARDTRTGFHGKFVADGGSYNTLDGYFLGQYQWGKNTLAVSGDGSQSDHYLNPVVEQNFTNTGTNGDYALRYERDLSDSDRLSFQIRHGISRFEVPNELLQQEAGQRQDRSIVETLGIASYQHIFSPNILSDVRLMIRDDSQTLNSNPLSTPIEAFQNRGFRETYFKSSVSVHHGRHEFKAGIEADSTHLHEALNYNITDPSEFDPDTPLSFVFPREERWDLEQSAYIQDLIRLGKWTVSAGLRWDHYQLLVNKTAFSPRVSVARYFPGPDLVAHVSYDRVFQTPFFDNVLISSSPLVVSLSPDSFLRLPVQPSYGNYYEGGITKGFFNELRFDLNVYDRRADNYLDDDQLLNTGVSFPITFAKARIYGVEGKLELPHWHHWNAFASYSYQVGSAYFPVTGGLFLGDDATDALSGVGRFWDSQDQRNTFRTRARYEFTNRIWAAIGADYGSGLPTEFACDDPNTCISDAVAEYGQAVINRINFARNRVKPSLSVDLSIAGQIYKSEKLNMSLQGDVSDLNNRLNVVDFAGLFSGNAIAPQRSYALRLTTTF
jgi:outer membrane cobalamin receptor